jgi:hypothetical protein
MPTDGVVPTVGLWRESTTSRAEDTCGGCRFVANARGQSGGRQPAAAAFLGKLKEWWLGLCVS